MNRRTALTSLDALESMHSGRLLSGCWFAAALGVAIFQMRLLAQAWHQDPHALRTACLASAWVIGSVLGLRLQFALLRHSSPSASLWGSGLLGCTLLWLLGKAPTHTSSPLPFLSGPPGSTIVLVGMALLMGGGSTAWLQQRRPWPAVGERVLLARSLVSGTLGLCVVWLVPALSAGLGLVCLLPLLMLDLLPASLCPLPLQRGVLATLLESTGDPDRWFALRLASNALPPGWWWTSLVQRGRDYLTLTLLASSLTVLLGGLWNALPTPFAGGLVRLHESGLAKLVWLFAGQAVAFALMLWFCRAWRGVIGAPDRLIPSSSRRWVWRLALLSLFLMAGSLVLLGLPGLQAPWWLACSLGSYTLAAAVWGTVLPRLRGRISTQIGSARHLLFTAGTAMMPRYHLACEQTKEDQAHLVLATGEGVLTAAAGPVVGFLIDQLSVDGTLLVAGLFLALFLFLALCIAFFGWRYRFGQQECPFCEENNTRCIERSSL
jgi:hypothetical protein